MLKTPRFWIAIAATLTVLGGVALPDADAQTKFTVGNAGGSSADAERKVFYGPFANARSSSPGARSRVCPPTSATSAWCCRTTPSFRT